MQGEEKMEWNILGEGMHLLNMRFQGTGEVEVSMTP